jgi:hypothetical protein
MGKLLEQAHILVADPNKLVCEALRRLIELEVEVLGIVCDDSSLQHGPDAKTRGSSP